MEGADGNGQGGEEDDLAPRPGEGSAVLGAIVPGAPAICGGGGEGPRRRETTRGVKGSRCAVRGGRGRGSAEESRKIAALNVGHHFPRRAIFRFRRRPALRTE